VSKLVPRSGDPRALLDRILETPQLEKVVPQLPAELLHRIIEHTGLEDCGPLVALITPPQLARVFDLDLWHAARPGLDEHFDAARFGQWLEVLVESGAGVAAQKVAEMDADLVAAGLAHHARVFDSAAAAAYETTDGDVITPTGVAEDDVAVDIGGYRLIAKRADAWDAIVLVMTTLEKERPERFHRVMSGLRTLSNASFEDDGLDNLLGAGEQVKFDVALDREQRRDAGGFVTPAQARAFLKMSRQPPARRKGAPAGNPIARAYLNAGAEASAPPPADVPSTPETIAAVASVVEVLRDAGVLDAPPRALLTGSQESASPLALLHAHMQFVFDRDAVVYSARSAEIAYLANAILAGCSVQARPFTPEEASDAAAAVCNLGLENWPRRTDDVLLHHDLIDVFQVGWTLLHDEVAMYAAARLIAVLKEFEYHDREIQTALNRLRITLTKSLRAGEPWLARDAMEVLASLDTPAWVALLGLIDECPVLHAAVRATLVRGTRAIAPADFEFIALNSQITTIHEFTDALLDTLSR
jgi:Family of unknown function (DUF6178)